MTGKTCGRCREVKDSSEFYMRKGKPDTAWCKACYREWHRARYAPKNGADDSPRDCAWCGESYRPAIRKASIYCSPACKTRARHATAAQVRMDGKPTDRECLHCGSILPQSMRSDAVFCSATCNEKAHALQRKLRMRTGEDGKPGYLRAAICKRDGWKCGICGERVNASLEWPNPRAASLDHIIPVCEGGSNDSANLRLVHLTCNVKRRHLGGFEQLALFG